MQFCDDSLGVEGNISELPVTETNDSSNSDSLVTFSYHVIRTTPVITHPNLFLSTKASILPQHFLQSSPFPTHLHLTMLFDEGLAVIVTAMTAATAH